jgi:hypothetical protein
MHSGLMLNAADCWRRWRRLTDGAGVYTDSLVRNCDPFAVPYLIKMSVLSTELETVPNSVPDQEVSTGYGTVIG